MHALDITASRKEGMLVHFTYQNPVLLRPDQPLVTCQLCHAHQGVWVHLSWQLVTPTRPCLQSARAWVLRVSGPGRSLVYKDKVAIRLGPLCSCSSEAPLLWSDFFFFLNVWLSCLGFLVVCLCQECLRKGKQIPSTLLKMEIRNCRLGVSVEATASGFPLQLWNDSVRF